VGRWTYWGEKEPGREKLVDVISLSIYSQLKKKTTNFGYSFLDALYLVLELKQPLWSY
jgi:hypothetical protein